MRGHVQVRVSASEDPGTGEQIILIDAKAAAIAAALRTAELTQPAPLVAAFAAITRSLTAVIGAVNVEIDRLAGR